MIGASLNEFLEMTKLFMYLATVNKILTIGKTKMSFIKEGKSRSGLLNERSKFE